MNIKAQTVVELMLLLSVSILALSIVYFLYSSQLEVSNISRETSVAKSTINKIVNSANSLALSGAGSSEKILIEVPSDANVLDSNINGREIRFRLSNGSEVFGFSDVNIIGEFKKSNGQFVVDGYYVNLTFDGEKVIMSYDDFELNTNGIFVSAKQGTSVEKVFTIRNNSLRDATFWLLNNFSFSSFARVDIDPSDVYFTLAPNETRVIDLNIILSKFSSGNYAGNINVIGEINDGISDTNISKNVFVSVESFLEFEPVMIFPKSTSFSAVSGTSTIKSFSLCNSSESNVSVSWQRASNPDANMLSWFTWPIVDSEGVEIASVNSGDCAYFELNFSVPISAGSNVYDANITVTYGDGNSSSAYFFVDVSHLPLPYDLFFSTSTNTLPANYFLSNFVKQRIDTNYFIATGELDWNSSGDYSVNGSSWDLNLKAYYKFNSKSGTTIYDSAMGNNGTLVSGADINGVGLWDSNSLILTGASQYVNIGNISDLNFKLDSNFSISGWILPNSTFATWGTVFSKGNAIAAVPSYGIYCGSATSCNFRVRDASNMLECTFSPKVLAWNHFVCNKWSGTIDYCNCYLNGFVVSSSSKVKITPITSDSAYIGRGQAYYSGLIDEFKIYNRVLSASEVISDYNSFLSAKFVDSNIIDASEIADWNLVKVNKDINYSFGKEISISEKFGEGLVSLWHLNDKNSQGYILNSVTGIRDGNLVGGADVNAVGLWDTNAGYFDGVGDYFEASNRAEYNVGNNFSISVWIYPKANGATNGGDVFSKFYSAGPPYVSYGLELLSNNTLVFGSGGTDNSYTNTTVTPVLSLNRWYHIVATYDGSFKKMYLDGVLVDSDSYSKTIIYNTGNVTIGCWIGILSGNCFTGSIEELALYNRTISASEVNELYRKGVTQLDLDIYSCSDSTCSTKTSSQYISAINNNEWTNLNSSLLDSRYLGFDAYFKKASGFENYNAGTFYVGSFVNDFNVIYIK